MKLYAEISKTEELDDGSIKVWGYASSDVVDSDGETITADAMKAALPDYMKFGAVREMHQAKAAGTAIEAEVRDDGRTWFGAHIVDTEAVKKVKASVYKGFSIGGKATERDELNKTIIKSLRLIEVSLVDRPANPEAVFTMYKCDEVDKVTEPVEVPAIDALAELLNKGEITPERLIELAKAERAPKADPVVEKTVEVKPIEKKKSGLLHKGMGGVSNLASILSSINWLQQDTSWEAEYEGDGSELPAQLKAWLTTGGDLLRAMVDEEVAEMVGAADPDDMTDLMVQLSANPEDLKKRLEKSGKKFSSDTKDKLAKAHQAVKDASDHIAATGYEANDEDTGKAAGSDDLKKLSSAHEDLLKACGAAGCPEGTIASDFVAKLASDRDALQKRVTELEKMPAPGKALLKAVAKSEDLGSTIVDDTKINEVVVKDAHGNFNEAASLIKMIHQSGGAIAR